MSEQPSQHEKNSHIKIKTITDISPHSKVMHEAGRLLVIESINTTREFCKDMISTCTSAVPVYLGMLIFVLPEHYSLGIENGVLMSIPAVLFLFSSLIFTLGYLPVTEKFSVDLIEDIERTREKVLKRRSNLIKIGLTLFITAMLLGITVIVYSIGSR